MTRDSGGGPSGWTVILLMAGCLALLNAMLRDGPAAYVWVVLAAGLIGAALFRARSRT